MIKDEQSFQIVDLNTGHYANFRSDKGPLSHPQVLFRFYSILVLISLVTLGATFLLYLQIGNIGLGLPIIIGGFCFFLFHAEYQSIKARVRVFEELKFYAEFYKARKLGDYLLSLEYFLKHTKSDEQDTVIRGRILHVFDLVKKKQRIHSHPIHFFKQIENEYPRASSIFNRLAKSEEEAEKIRLIEEVKPEFPEPKNEEELLEREKADLESKAASESTEKKDE